jgi:hypothetical protein
MMNLYEDENRAYYIHWLKYVDLQELDEMLEVDDILDNDAYQEEDNKLPLEVD